MVHGIKNSAAIYTASCPVSISKVDTLLIRWRQQNFPLLVFFFDIQEPVKQFCSLSSIRHHACLFTV
jgi:hypothetical protein